MIDWFRIDTVLLDMDGTLIDLRFDNHLKERRRAELLRTFSSQKQPFARADSGLGG